jgi:general L-amino acid transport system permease protein
MTAVERSGRPPGGSGEGRRGAAALLYDPKVRGIVFQVAAVALVLLVGYIAISNAIANLSERGIASGFDFLDEVAGFDISQSLVPYANTDSYGRAFVVGLLNTMLVAAVGIVIATILGFTIGIMRLSKNWLLRQIAVAYIELLRNIPLLVQLFFWYFAILKQLPGVRDSIPVGLGAQLNIRGLYLPEVRFAPEAQPAGILLIGAIVMVWLIARWAKLRQDRTGERFPAFGVGLALLVGLPLIGLAVNGFPVSVHYPELQGFNFVGGINLNPEFLALLLGLSLSTAAFIAEIVRAGILAIGKGQTEASYALGLRPKLALRLVIIPQALRVIVPPLTNQYLNLTKNSSLAVAIGYPDLVSVFAGTVLNQTGQAVEIILITMGVYLTLSILTSIFMNWFNRRIALVER